MERKSTPRASLLPAAHDVPVLRAALPALLLGACLAQEAQGAVGDPPIVPPWYWYQDAFPANDAPGLPGTAAFDTAAAHVKLGVNIAPSTGLNRPAVPGDSMVLQATGAGMRVDLVFGIRPGPGNYVDPTNLARGLKKLPTAPAVAVAGDGSFWGQYMARPGDFASPGAAAQHAAAPGGWDKDVWNSARLDTAERNIFPVAARGNLPGISGGIWASMYHDDDPRGGRAGNGGLPGPLARPKNRCFLIDPAGSTGSSNITCGSGTYPPGWVTGPGTGYDGSPITYEYEKVLPDGVFTPGTHVRYFNRKSLMTTGEFFTTPDTGVVTLQYWESSSDGHRWQQFSVLPDGWKAYEGGSACMLYVDGCDRRGNERVWISVADSIGATVPAKWGAHNGWHAVGGGADVNLAANNRRPDGSVGFISAHGGQPGTSFDMFGIKAAESLTSTVGAFGSRLAAPGTGLLAGKEAKVGPTLEMLQAYYPMLLWLSGDLTSGVLGPFSNRTSNDVQMIVDYLSSATPSEPRGFFAMGDGFVQSSAVVGEPHIMVIRDYFGVVLRSPSYVAISGNLEPCPDVIPAAPIGTTDLYGSAGSVCRSGNEVFALSEMPEAAADLYYENVGSAGPYIAGARTGTSASKHFVTQVVGMDIEDLSSRFCTGSLGRLSLMRDVLVNVFGSLCPLTGAPVGLGDDPRAVRGVDYLRLASANPFRSGAAVIEFGLARGGKVVVAIYDVAGRRVRVLANRVFPAGNGHKLIWDGLDDSGKPVARGVYFYRLKSPSFMTTRRVIVLR